MVTNNANLNYDYDNPEDGKVIEASDIGTLAVLNKSEIDQQVATAKKYPRSIKKFRDEALQLATLDEQTAMECIYALPRGGKTIEGPSARFAEVISYAWGNVRIGARQVSEDAEFVTSQGMFYDLEKNVGIAYEVKRRITDSKNRRYSADMIGTTSNAASSIALRNAVLKGIPKAIWRPIYDAARKVVAGDITTLANKRENALQAFAIFGVTPQMIYDTLGVKGKEDIGIDHMVALSGFLTAIKEGEAKAEEIFSPRNAPSENAGAATEAKADQLKEKYAKKAEPKQETAEEQSAKKNEPEKKEAVKGMPLQFGGTSSTRGYKFN